MGDTRVVYMLALLCSLIANTSADSEGKQFVYRRSTGGTGRISVPDPSMMQAADFIPDFGGEKQVQEPEHRKGMSDVTANDFVDYLKSNFGAIDKRKSARDKPRQSQ